MRLWDYRLLKVLPDRFIVAQWRECIAIKRQWEKGTLKHRLVSYVMDYNKAPFYQYVVEVRAEMYKRNIKYNDKYFQEIIKFTFNDLYNILDMPYYPEHNDRYLKQCLYNFEEKATRNIISKEEWLKIYNEFKDFTDLWDGE